MAREWVFDELKRTINSLDWQQAAEDVRRFVWANEQPSLDLWSKELFLHQLGKLAEETGTEP